jgi:hypothetical protein
LEAQAMSVESTLPNDQLAFANQEPLSSSRILLPLLLLIIVSAVEIGWIGFLGYSLFWLADMVL